MIDEDLRMLYICMLRYRGQIVSQRDDSGAHINISVTISGSDYCVEMDAEVVNEMIRGAVKYPLGYQQL